MGLDMYLSRKLFVKNYPFMKDEERYTVTIERGGVPLDFGEVSEISTEVAHWRKADAIHQWFVDNVQNGEDNCSEYYVPTDLLIELRDTCTAVLADPSRAGELLPPQGGVSFGGTEIDDGYLDDLRYTVEVLDKALAAEDETFDNYYYQADW